MIAETGPLNPSTHFSYDKMVKMGVFTTPQQQANLVRLCQGTMEAVRSLLNVPPEIMKGLDPSDPLHAQGLAVDFRAPGWALGDALAAITGSLIPFAGVWLEESTGPGDFVGLTWHIHLTL